MCYQNIYYKKNFRDQILNLAQTVKKSWHQYFQVQASSIDNNLFFKSETKVHTYNYSSIVHKIFQSLALTVFEEMRGQNHVPKCMQKGR